MSTITKGSGNDKIFGSAGNDTLKGGSGNDQIVTDSGTDYAYGESGDDNINGYLGLDGKYQFWTSSGTQWLYGGEGNDTIFGGTDVDNILGEAGNDYLNGREGNDVIDGGLGDDELRGNEGDDVISGGLGDDTLYGEEGNDSLKGGAGDDKLYSGNGLDNSEGGLGDDTLHGYLQEGVKLFRGGEGNDTIYGGIDDDFLYGDEGVDIVSGYAGNDVIDGGHGDDELYGNEGDDTLSGGEGVDELHGNEGNDTLNGDAGSDWMQGGEGDDTYYIDDIWDDVYDTSGNDALHISVDYYNVDSTIENIQYSDGVKALPYWIDALIYDESSVHHHHYLENDKTFKYLFPQQVLSYFDAKDLNGWSAAESSLKTAFIHIASLLSSLIDVKFVQTSNAYQANTIAVSTNAQTGSGGYAANPDNSRIYDDFGGSDIFMDKSNADPSITSPNYDLDSLVHELGHALGLKHPFSHENASGNIAQTPYLTSILEENTRWTAMSYTDDAKYYSTSFRPLDLAALQYLYGVSSSANAGDTTYTFSKNEGTLVYDGQGIDTIDATTATAAATIFLTQGDWSYVGVKSDLITASNQLTINFNTVIESVKGGSFNDSLYGNDIDNIMEGNSGSDDIYGYLGNDTISGGQGNDTISGGQGNDRLYGGDGGDEIYTGSGDDTVLGGTGNDSINGNQNREEFTYDVSDSSGTQRLYGGDGDDDIFGGVNSDYLYGEAGVDFLIGGDGDDNLFGGNGDDFLYTGNGIDYADGGLGDDLLYSDLDLGSKTLKGGDGDDIVYGGINNDFLYGDAGNDIVEGGDGDDYLYGGAGNDYLYGEAGTDILDGGSGLDFSSYRSSITQHSILNAGDKIWTVNDLADNTTDSLLNVERVYFNDKTVALDIGAGEIGGSCYRIYKAAFNRSPDHLGLGYWIGQMDLGKDLYSVSAEFIGSNEFKTLYGANPSNDDFLTKVYSNVLGREPDAGGYAWWLGQLETNHAKTWTQVLTDFSESAENRESVLALIGNGIEYDYYWAV